MAGELNFYGIYIPFLLIEALLAYVVYLFLVKIINKWQLERWIMLPTIFHLCLYIVVLGVVVGLTRVLV